MLGYVLGITLVLAVLSPVLVMDIFADSLIVNFNEASYGIDDSLIVSGKILEIGMPVIAMSIYDPDGKIMSANNIEISSEQTFTKTVYLDSSYYDIPGEYLIKFDYGTISENHYFVIEGEVSEPNLVPETPEILLLYSEQKQYTDNEVVKISGLVSVIDSPTVLIGIYDPFGMPAGFYFGSVDSNLEFNTSFLVKDGVNFRVDGTYSVKAHYADSEVISFFDYHKNPIITKNTLDDEIIESEVNEDESIFSPIDDNLKNTFSDDSTLDTSEQFPIQSENIPTKNMSFESSIEKINDVQITETEITETAITETAITETEIILEKLIPNEIKQENHLTVEDIELGKLLNQIKLECDSSTYIDTISYYDGMGPALYRLCKFDSSLNFFNESLINNPNDVEILVNKGSTLGKLGYFSEAIVYYDQAIGIDPTFLPAKNNKANALANLGNFEDAISLYYDILKQNPNYLTARINLENSLNAVHITSESFELNIETISTTENIPSEKTVLTTLQKEKSANFFDEVGVAFSTLGSLFNFLN